MEGRVKILGKYPKSEGIISFCPIFFVHLQTFIIKQGKKCFGPYCERKAIRDMSSALEFTKVC